MKERPIIFSGPMVRAILEGRKTQTRRVVKKQHLPDAPERFDAYEFERILPNGNEQAAFGFNGGDGYTECVCPYGRPGDRLWVRETFSVYDHPQTHAIHYRASGDNGFLKWSPSIHMPRKFARLFLQVKNVRVERLQTIDAGGAVKEGSCTSVYRDTFGNAAAVLSFEKLWRDINDKRKGCSWDANPWVWVIDFERVDLRQDAPG